MLSYRIDEDLELAIPRIKDAEALYDAIAGSRESLRRYLPWVGLIMLSKQKMRLPAFSMIAKDLLLMKAWIC